MITAVCLFFNLINYLNIILSQTIPFKRFNMVIKKNNLCVSVTLFHYITGGNRITFWSFRKDDATGPSSNVSRKTSQQSQQMHTSSITCIDISRDGTMAVTGNLYFQFSR